MSWPQDGEMPSESAAKSRGRQSPVHPQSAVLGQLLPAFEGSAAPAWLLRHVADGHAHGVTLFLRANAAGADQLRTLADSLHAAAPGRLPLLIGADQEGGQLVGLGHETTRFPGAMALGAADDVALTEAVGLATGRELRALGITVAYAPVCDLAVEPGNISLGTRAFGAAPDLVARQAAALARGLATGGVAATPKHFPGFGAVDSDPHYGLSVIDRDLAALEASELVPFQAAFDAGAAMVMSGHVSVPAITGDRSLPATVSREVMHDLLRKRMGFTGVSITDAMDMKAVAQGTGQVVDSIVALRAGVDLLLMTPDRAAQKRLEVGLRQAALRGLIPASRIRSSHRRIMKLRRWLRGFGRPALSIVHCDAHRELAKQAATAALTLVRNEARLLPLRLRPEARIVVVTPEPRDLTPADSSATEPLGLAAAVRRHHPLVDDIRTSSEPTADEISAARDSCIDADVVIVATMATNAQPSQAELVNAILTTGTPTVTVAMRTPYDLSDYPDSTTHLCAYSIVPASVGAVADAIFGAVSVNGRLPVDIPGLYARGHGIEVNEWP